MIRLLALFFVALAVFCSEGCGDMDLDGNGSHTRRLVPDDLPDCQGSPGVALCSEERVWMDTEIPCCVCPESFDRCAWPTTIHGSQFIICVEKEESCQP